MSLINSKKILQLFRDDNHMLFPLKSIVDVIKLFQYHLKIKSEPDLVLLSIIIGYIENKLTSNRVTNTNASVITGGTSAGSTSSSNISENIISSTTDNNQTTASGTSINILNNFPVINFEKVELLYKKFSNIISSIVDNKVKIKSNLDTRNIIKKISDIIWNSLTRSSYKDRAHLQSIYSYVNDNKLDCFGVAFAVVAGCQLIGLTDVHLALSEDHAWIVFGKDGCETIEVTWHGKGLEDKRGQTVMNGIKSHFWLYLSGNPVICNRYMEVAALVSSINPSLNMNSACLELADLQQKLLWLLFDMGYLDKYPMGLGALGELEEISPTTSRLNCDELYKKSITSSKENYNNHHVYPYTCQGGYYYRKNMYKEAFSSWANASDVIRLYNYSRDDEEIYKEFLDIANEIIPTIMKQESSGHSAHSILRDPQCFANLLRFYDGICQWEEGSLTPILHIGWAKPLVSTITKFDYDIRSQVIINDNNNKQIVQTPTYSRLITIITAEANNNNNSNNNNIVKKDIKDEQILPTTLEELTAACGEKILNPEFLLQGDGYLFKDNQLKNNVKEESNDRIVSTTEKNGENVITKDNKIKSQKNIEVKNIEEVEMKEGDDSKDDTESYDADDILRLKRPVITLYSYKMKGLKELLLSEKLNTHAISLQLTAQSQVQVGGKKMRSQQNQSTSSSSSSINITNITNLNNSNDNHKINTSNNESLNNSTNTNNDDSGIRSKRSRRE